MMQSHELNLKQDLAYAFPFVETVVNEHVILVIAYMALTSLSGVFSSQPAPFVDFAAWLIYLAIACHYIRMVANGLVSGEPKEPSFNKQGVPLLSLFFLEIIYFVVFVCGLLFFVVPGFWWAVTSVVAVVVVVLEDVGAISALARSHRLVKGNFWPVFIYLLKVSLAVLLPLMFLNYGLSETMRFLTMRAMSEPLYIGAQVIINLLKGVVLFIGQLVFLSCLTKLYLHLKSIEPTVPLAPVVQTPIPTTLQPGIDPKSSGQEMDLPPGALD